MQNKLDLSGMLYILSADLQGLFGCRLKPLPVTPSLDRLLVYLVYFCV